MERERGSLDEKIHRHKTAVQELLDLRAHAKVVVVDSGRRDACDAFSLTRWSMFMQELERDVSRLRSENNSMRMRLDGIGDMSS